MLAEIAIYMEILTNNLNNKPCDATASYEKIVRTAQKAKNPDWALLAKVKHLNHLTCGYSKYEYGIERLDHEDAVANIPSVRSINEILRAE